MREEGRTCALLRTMVFLRMKIPDVSQLAPWLTGPVFVHVCSASDQTGCRNSAFHGQSMNLYREDTEASPRTVESAVTRQPVKKAAANVQPC